MSSIASSPHESGPAPVERQTLASAVIDRLVEYIRTDPLGPGDLLPSQHELARRLGVSRPVLREALQGLASLGMLEIRPGSGVYVRDPGTSVEADGLIEIATHEMALEVLEARMVVEVEMAGLAATRADADDFARMDKVLTRLKRTSARGQSTSQITSDFHRALARSSHNSMLYRMAQMLAKARVAQGARVEAAMPDIAMGEYESHLRLRNAVASGEPDVARLEMRRHLELAHGWEEQLLQLRRAAEHADEPIEEH